MARENVTKETTKARGVHKTVDIADLTARVERLELEAREVEAKNRIHQGRVLLEKHRAEQAPRRAKTARPA